MATCRYSQPTPAARSRRLPVIQCEGLAIRPSFLISRCSRSRASLPRKDSYAYFSTPGANNGMLHAKQGVSDLLRAYFFLKSADNPDNHPHRLASASATELAKLATYYIMNMSETMATTVAPMMPTKEQVVRELWLSASELEVYTREYERTGFQGGLN